ncbi:MAG: hypothetical protein LKJ76_01115 [Lachnospiraceae bacterium]|nr:hypothetical protein [Lachnospiraceae bacterium]
MNTNEKKIYHPLAITMWDFSWIERNWEGSGYENIDAALDGLVERGYNAVRIDAFPHLMAEDRNREWTLKPVWFSNDWGSPYINKIKLYPAFTAFLGKCRERNIKVALSSWYREDEDNIRMRINSPEKMADNWLTVLDLIRGEGLLDTVLYVDLCNEWPGDLWAPFFTNFPKECTWGYWYTETSMHYMKRAIERIREKYPDIPLCFSFDGLDTKKYASEDLSFFDFIEHHIWMTKLNDNEFYRFVGQDPDGRWNETSYHYLVDNSQKVYQERPEYWKKLLRDGITELARNAEARGMMLATTECWGIVDYKDYPLLPWDWVKDLCRIGVETALSTDRWFIVATSNFTGPQFAGMWNDVSWHKELTALIRSHEIPEDRLDQRLRNTIEYR